MSNDYTLPPVPDHPFANSLSERWSEMEEVAIGRYGKACAEDARAPLLARIAELEAEVNRWREIQAAVAQLEGAGTEWPDHGNAPLAITAGYALHKMQADRLRAEVEALRALLDGAAKTRSPKPRTLPTVGTGALHGEQQYNFEKGYREGASAVRKAIAVKVAAIAAQAQAKGGAE